MKNKLPDGAMRYSMFEAWLQNPAEAMKRYFPANTEERTHFTNKWMEFGSKVAEDLCQRPLPDYLKDVPVYDKSEHRIYHEIEGFMMRGSLDTYSTELHKFADHKSVKQAWTQGKTNKHKQLDFYSVLVEEAYGWVDEECHIFCIPVDADENDIVRRTGEPVIRIPRIITADERKTMKKLMVDTAREISTVYQSYLAGNIKL